MTADEIVTGSFRNISGQIVKIDLPGNALTVKDLATKASLSAGIRCGSQGDPCDPSTQENSLHYLQMVRRQ